MINRSINELVKGAPVVAPEDTLRRAASLISATEGSSVIVLTQGRILGTISERSIVARISIADDPEAALDSHVSELIQPDLTYVNSGSTLQAAAGIFAAVDVDMLPVIDNYGGYRGVLYRSELLGCLARTMKPPTVAGMATPLGVYLTTGSVSGGTNSIGLLLTGASLATMVISSRLIAVGLMMGFGRLTGIPVDRYLMSPPIGVLNIYDIPMYISVVLQMLVFGMLMRLSPLSGYHAAEHMTVHAIEAGEDLRPDSVRKMPRVHPRCGTNLLAGAGLFLIVSESLGGNTAMLIALLVMILGWRTVGGWLQYFVTTRNPSAKQLANGVEAGRQVVEKYHENPNLQLKGFARIWKLGFLQNALGMLIVFAILDLLMKKWPIPWLF